MIQFLPDLKIQLPSANRDDSTPSKRSGRSFIVIRKGTLKTRDWKTRDHEKYGGGKHRTGKHGTKFPGLKTHDHRLLNAKWISVKLKETLYDMYIIL